MSDGNILGFARTVRHDGGITSVFRGENGFDSLGEGADLVGFNQDRVGYARVNAFL